MSANEISPSTPTNVNTTDIPVIYATAIPVNTNTSSPSSTIVQARRVSEQLTSSVLPMNVEDGEMSTEYTERQHGLYFVYRLSKAVKTVCVIQVVLLCVFLAYSLIFLIVLPFPIIGYYGAKYYSYWYLYIYCVYVICEIIGGIVSIILMSDTNFIILRIIYILVLLSIVRMATRIAAYTQVCVYSVCMYSVYIYTYILYTCADELCYCLTATIYLTSHINIYIYIYK